MDQNHDSSTVLGTMVSTFLSVVLGASRLVGDGQDRMRNDERVSSFKTINENDKTQRFMNSFLKLEVRL